MADRRDRAARARLVDRLEREFLEMPGLRLTVLQTARLLGTSPEIGQRILATLSDQGVLAPSDDGCYSLGRQRT
jgi:hypothetical protein